MSVRNFWVLVFATFIAIGCSPAGTEDDVTSVPPTEALAGFVDITFPPSGAIIYAETILIEGTATDVPAEGFEIALIAPDDSVVASAPVMPDGDTWSVELVHDYAGDPTEITVMARPAGGSTADYDLETLLLSRLDLRPEGVFGSISVPQDGGSIGGDTLPIAGRGSGFFEGTFILILEAEDSTLISETVVTMRNPYFVDDLPWEAEIPRNDYVGAATLRMVYQDAATGDMITVDSIDITVTEVAG